MSDINTSTTSIIDTPLHCSTLKLSPEVSNTINELPFSRNVVNNSKTNTDTGISTEKINKNSIVITNNHCSNTEYKDENKNKLPRLIIKNDEITNNSVNVVNDLLKGECVTEEDAFQLGKIRETVSSPNTPKLNKPIMGKAALLKKANVERNDSLIIHELITDRYNGVLSHYFNRMYKRKCRMDSSEDEYSDTVFSSPPNCSPVSISSIDTPGSLFEGERHPFHFPKQKKDLGFLNSTDDVNKETTVEDLDTSSLNSSGVSKEKSAETSISDYDTKKFLKTAIGEVANVSCESGIVNDVTETNEITSVNEVKSSVGPSDISSLISRTNCLYNSLRETFCKKTNNQPVKDENNLSNNHRSVVSSNASLDNLMRELAIQNEILFQISKALDYCRTIKGFETTVEFLEAEKILLVASCTKAALTKEIQDAEDESPETKHDSKCTGQIHLKDLIFFPKDTTKCSVHDEFTEHFVVILTCGSTVLASDVTTADEKGMVHVEKSFEFKDLSADFEIVVCIYAMRVNNKPHHNQDHHHHCPSAKKFFFNKVIKKNRLRNETLFIKSSSFLLWGKCEIRSHDLSKAKSIDDNSITLKMSNVPLTSTLSGIFSVKINSSVKLSNRMNGFLTVGMDNEHGCIIWNVRWCALEGTVLKYWNHPSEETTDPLGSLDLSYCLEQQISTVDRSLCARPRTLMVPIRNKVNIKKYLLSADNLSSMKQWEKELNYILRVLSMWNCGGIKIS